MYKAVMSKSFHGGIEVRVAVTGFPALNPPIGLLVLKFTTLCLGYAAIRCALLRQNRHVVRLR